MLASLLLAACAAGPNFKAPGPPSASRYVAHLPVATASTPGVAGGISQHFTHGAPVAANWWHLFHSTTIDQLVATALEHNHDLKAAQAALKVAHEAVLAQRGVFLPSLAAGAATSRQRNSEALAPVPNFPLVPHAFQYNLFTPQLSISYAPDLFGLDRRTRESLQAQEQAVRYQALALRTTLATNVVVAAVDTAALREQIGATRRLARLERQGLALTQLRLDKGAASRLDVAAQQSQLAQTQASVPTLVKQAAVSQHALDVLLGVGPAHSAGAGLTLAELHLPTDLPLSLPSQLVVQRPDVLQARADLHAASAAIGIAAAERLPQFVLSANVGHTALRISHVFDSGTGFWGLAASLTTPIFDGGALLHQERAAKAAYVEAAQTYRSVVLHALQNVADTLVALHQDALALHAAAKADRATQTTLALTRLELAHGAVSGIELLVAEQGFQQAQIELVQVEANRFADTAALYQALGGGWWHQKEATGS
ncbi:MAG TPA: efflux transporter outer membrane subunit [Nevskiaceae bacterium]|nr:efflux transporter outer membrane subunit [Nevskiaceae bacterium]